ncbi:DMB protein, partial [Bucco capensis]|nr:DMB protein [Bucco capensis]
PKEMPPPLTDTFVVHVATSCPLATNGSVVAFEFNLVFNKNPLVCYEAESQHFIACDWGLLHQLATSLATTFNKDKAWLERAEGHRRACHQLATNFWATTGQRRTPPQVRIVPSKTSPAATSPVLLTCHVWGFYPSEVTVTWLHNGVVTHGEHLPISSTPNGDWTYQTQVTLLVTPMAGDTFTCLVQHSSLEQALLEQWSPGLSAGLTWKVVVATVLMLLGLGFFTLGVYYFRFRPPAAGYTPLPGDTYPAGN